MTTSRVATIQRTTKETDIKIELNLDPSPSEVAQGEINSGIGFLDHMLDALARHCQINLSVSCDGDLHIDQHHTVEDIGISLGQAFSQALGDLKGVQRFGLMECPLDEALVKTVIDLSGRPYLHYGLKFTRDNIGALDSSLLKEFFMGFVLHAKWTVHLDCIRGDNDHHIAEAAFKSFARSARQAITQTGSQEIPSTKGVLV